MKHHKRRKAAAIIASLGLVAGCALGTEGEASTSEERSELQFEQRFKYGGSVSSYGVSVIKDTKYGCEYLLFNDNDKAAMQPRYGSCESLDGGSKR